MPQKPDTSDFEPDTSDFEPDTSDFEPDGEVIEAKANTGEGPTIANAAKLPQPPKLNNRGEPFVDYKAELGQLLTTMFDAGKKGWDAINSPMTNIPSKLANMFASALGDEPTMQFSTGQAPITIPTSAAKSMVTGAGKMGDDLTSPLNAGLALATGGGSLAEKYGLTGTAKALNYGARALSAPVAAEGAYHTLRPGADIPERIGGGLEALVGGVGMRAPTPSTPGGPDVDNLIGKLKRALDEANSPPKANIMGQEVVVTPFQLGTSEIRGLTKAIKKSKHLEPVVRVQAGEGLRKILFREVPTNDEVAGLEAVFGADTLASIREAAGKPQNKMPLWKEAINLPRAMQSSMDLSYPFRQGAGLIMEKAWWTSWDDMVRAAGSERAYQAIQDEILEKPLFKRVISENGQQLPSFADRAGLAMTDLKSAGNREEEIMAGLAEKLPVVGKPIRASNRAFTAFALKLRTDHFEKMIESARTVYKAAKLTAKTDQELLAAEMLNPDTNGKLSHDIAQFINNATGRGSLGAAEPFAVGLNSIFFSPRLIASRIQYMNPANYISKGKQVREAYLKSLLGMATMWSSVATLGAMAGGKVSFDPTNSDFMKVKFGNTRLDPGAGFQQYMVMLARSAAWGRTSSTTGKFSEFGGEYGVDTMRDALIEFGSNKLSPIGRFASFWAAQSKYKPFFTSDEALKLFIPMIAQDLTDIAQNDPSLMPVGFLSAVGMGTQTYGRGKPKPTYLGKGGAFGRMPWQ